MDYINALREIGNKAFNNNNANKFNNAKQNFYGSNNVDVKPKQSDSKLLNDQKIKQLDDQKTKLSEHYNKSK